MFVSRIILRLAFLLLRVFTPDKMQTNTSQAFVGTHLIGFSLFYPFIVPEERENSFSTVKELEVLLP